MEIVKKESNPEYKQDLKKKRIAQYSTMEDFVSSQWFQEWFKLITSVISNIEMNIISDESPEENEAKYTMKQLKIMLRKELIKLRNEPSNRLKQLSMSLDILGRTE